MQSEFPVEHVILDVHVLFPHLLVVIRNPLQMVAVYRDLMADRTMDIVQSVEEAKRLLLGPGGRTVSQILCEDQVADGVAADLHAFLTERKSMAYFVVLGGSTLAFAGKGVPSVPKPIHAERIRAAFLRFSAHAPAVAT